MVLIALIGPNKNGIKTILEYLKSKHFQTLAVKEDADVEFSTFEELLIYSTSNWDRNHVIINFDSAHMQTFKKRPFFLCIGVIASLKALYQQSGLDSLEEFIETYESLDWASLLSRCEIVINQKSPENKQVLYEKLEELSLLSSEWIRPSWSSYFMRLADLAAQRSNCMKRRVGAVLVKDNRVVSTGYNGTPRNTRNCNEGGCPRCNDSNIKCGERLDTCLCLHAEENALLEAGRDRAQDGILYCNTCPCLSCAKKIAQMGIQQVIYGQEYGMDELTRTLLENANVKLSQFKPVNDRTVITI